MSEGTREARFVLGALATWRLTRLVAYEDGPADVIVRIRARIGDAPLGSFLDCFSCVTIWIAAPVALAVVRQRRDAPLTWLALSGAACLVERATALSGHEPAERGTGVEADELLWREKASA
jgi:hypothetical protein